MNAVEADKQQEVADGEPGKAIMRGLPAGIAPRSRSKSPRNGLTRRPWCSRTWRAGSQADDDQGGVVGEAAGREQVGQHGVGEGFGVGCRVAGQGAGEPREAGVDVLAAAFDQAVGVQHEGGAVGERLGGLDPGGVFGAGAERGVGGLVEELDGAAGLAQGRRGCPALL